MTRASAPAVVGQGLAVLGMGNALLGDDGAGIRALALLEESGELPPGARLVDGGTAGTSLLDALAGCNALVVFDAVDAGQEPGAVVRLDLRGGLSGAAGRTAHEWGLSGLLADLMLLDHIPERVVLFGIQPESVSIGTTLSPAVERGVASAVRAALEELRRWAEPQGETHRTR